MDISEKVGVGPQTPRGVGRKKKSKSSNLDTHPKYHVKYENYSPSSFG